VGILQSVPLSRTYWRMNRAIDTYKAYLILLDIVLRGTIVQTDDESAVWVNHDYTLKHNLRLSRTGSPYYPLRWLLLRLNVYYCYLTMVRSNLGLVAVLCLTPICALALSRDIVLGIFQKISLTNRLRFLSYSRNN
jgi:hypothetical protein